jgi:hypothetical protein
MLPAGAVPNVPAVAPPPSALAPAGELAQVEGVGLACQAPVPGQEPGEREPLGISEHRLDGDEGS